MKTFLIFAAMLCFATCYLVKKCECDTNLVVNLEVKRPVCGIKYWDGKQIKETFLNESLACSIGKVEFIVEGCCEDFPCDAYFCNPFQLSTLLCSLSFDPQCAYLKYEGKSNNKSNQGDAESECDEDDQDHQNNAKNEGKGENECDEDNQGNKNNGKNEGKGENECDEDKEGRKLNEKNGGDKQKECDEDKLRKIKKPICTINEPNSCIACINREVLYIVKGYCPRI